MSEPPHHGSCRACPVRCERVVYPAHCVQIACPRLYAHEQDGVRWIGCIDKVYSAEVDLGRLLEQDAQHPGFGALLAERMPRAECKAAIDRTFPQRDAGECTEPVFRTSFPEAPEGREPLRTRRG
ncbi:MAG: hypothetical protein KGQ95_03505 [Acidobacteria bacterium]|nr:hypothetical protein [Acidobacteriota bacterium]